jgi:hypothetical protein
VEDDSKRMPVAGTQPAYAVAEVDPIWPACPLHRSVMPGEDHAVSSPQLDNLCAGLHARPLFRQYELTPGEVLAWDRQQEGDLQRKHMFSVEIHFRLAMRAGNSPPHAAHSSMTNGPDDSADRPLRLCRLPSSVRMGSSLYWPLTTL